MSAKPKAQGQIQDMFLDCVGNVIGTKVEYDRWADAAADALAASSGRQPPAEVCGSAAGDAESMPAGEREGRSVTPQTLSHRGSVVNFCVGGKLGRSAKKNAPSFWSVAPI